MIYSSSEVTYRFSLIQFNHDDHDNCCDICLFLLIEWRGILFPFNDLNMSLLILLNLTQRHWLFFLAHLKDEVLA